MALPVSTTRISGGTMISAPPNTQVTCMVISRPGSTASRRSSSAPPNTQVTWLAGSGCQRPLRDTPPNTASIRAPRPAGTGADAGAGTGEAWVCGERCRSSSTGTSSACVFAA